MIATIRIAQLVAHRLVTKINGRSGLLRIQQYPVNTTYNRKLLVDMVWLKDRRMDGWMDGWMAGWMDGWMEKLF